MAKSQLDFYLEQQDELVKNHNGKFIAMKDGQFFGEFPTPLHAVRDMERRGFKNGEFLVIRCTPGDSEYTADFVNWRFIDWQSNVKDLCASTI